MLKETGHIVAVEGDYAWVETHRSSACGHCASQQGCGTSALAGFFNQKPSRVRAFNSAAAKVGERVEVGLQEQALLSSSLLVYLLPLLALFAGVLVYEGLSRLWGLAPTEGGRVLAGLGGLFVGFGGVKYLASRLARNTAYQPVVLSKL